YLLPKQLKANGLKEGELKVSEGALRDIIRYYTRESGVRNLEREISKSCRKDVKVLSLRESEAKAAKGAEKEAAKVAVEEGSNVSKAMKIAKAAKADKATRTSVTSANLDQ